MKLEQVFTIDGEEVKEVSTGLSSTYDVYRTTNGNSLYFVFKYDGKVGFQIDKNLMITRY